MRPKIDNDLFSYTQFHPDAHTHTQTLPLSLSKGVKAFNTHLLICPSWSGPMMERCAASLTFDLSVERLLFDPWPVKGLSQCVTSATRDLFKERDAGGERQRPPQANVRTRTHTHTHTNTHSHRHLREEPETHVGLIRSNNKNKCTLTIKSLCPHQ